MNAFDLLKADHQKVAELFDRLEAASGQAKLSVFQQINSELEVHTHIEEKIFYPAVEGPQETHALTLEAYEEHKVVKRLLAELSEATAADDQWQAKAKVLRENVEHHVEEEENELFDKAKDVLSDEEIETLGQRMEAEKARKLDLPTSAIRESNEKKGIVDRIKDMVGLGSEPAPRKRAPAKPVPRKTAPAKPQAKKQSTAKARKKTSGKKVVGKKKSAAKSAKRSKKAGRARQG
jgi:hemerythrin-like domain-containing protein